MTQDDQFRQQIDDAIKAFESWEHKDASLQGGACCPEEAACSICYLSGLASGETEQPKHAVIVLCPSPSAYIQMYEWRDGMLRPREGGKYAVDGSAFEGSVKSLVDQFVGKPASLVEQMIAMQEAQDAIDRLFVMLIEADPKFRPSQSGQPWEAMSKLTAAIEHAKGRIQYACSECGSESELTGWAAPGSEIGDYMEARGVPALGQMPIFRCAKGHRWSMGLAATGGNGHAATEES